VTDKQAGRQAGRQAGIKKLALLTHFKYAKGWLIEMMNCAFCYTICDVSGSYR
jgi:hypothetical protein